MKQEIIQYIGVNELDDMQKGLVDKLSTEYHEKIKNKLKNMTSMVVHLKHYDKEGNKPRYSIRIRVLVPTRIFESDRSEDWDLAKSLHRAFQSIERQIEHKLHTDSPDSVIQSRVKI